MDLNQVTVPCLDYDESVAFYSLLGLHQIVASPPRYARFDTTSGTTFSLHTTEAPLLTESATVIYFEVENVDAEVARLKDAGLEFEHEARDQSWLWREARLRDPAGNNVCIYTAGENRRFPPWRLEERCED